MASFSLTPLHFTTIPTARSNSYSVMKEKNHFMRSRICRCCLVVGESKVYHLIPVHSTLQNVGPGADCIQYQFQTKTTKHTLYITHTHADYSMLRNHFSITFAKGMIEWQSDESSGLIPAEKEEGSENMGNGRSTVEPPIRDPPR